MTFSIFYAIIDSCKFAFVFLNNRGSTARTFTIERAVMSYVRFILVALAIIVVVFFGYAWFGPGFDAAVQQAQSVAGVVIPLLLVIVILAVSLRLIGRTGAVGGTFNEFFIPSIGYIIFIGGNTALGLGGIFFSPPFLEPTTTSLIGMFLWTLLYVLIGIRIVPQAEIWAVLRLEQFVRLGQKGLTILCLPPLIDMYVRIPTTYQRLLLYRDEKGELGKKSQIDFRGGVTAPIDIEVFYRIIGGENATYETIKDFLFKIGNIIDKIKLYRGAPDTVPYSSMFVGVIDYIQTIIDAALRPILQRMTLDEARTYRGNIAAVLNGVTTGVADIELEPDEDGNARRISLDDLRAAQTNIVEALKGVGIELQKDKGILIPDIDIPQAIQDIRAIEVKAEANRRAFGAESRGVVEAIKVIQDEAPDDQGMTFGRAQDLFLVTRALNVMERKEGTVNFFSSDVRDAVGSLLGSFAGPGRRPRGEEPSPGGIPPAPKGSGPQGSGTPPPSPSQGGAGQGDQKGQRQQRKRQERS